MRHVAAGILHANPEEGHDMHVLFVCTGNICRSPTAERVTRAFAVKHGLSRLTASSAGTRAVVGYGMEPTAAEVLRTLGGDPKGFRARQLSPANVDDADLILTMTTRHRDKVLAASPRAMRRTFTLLEAGRLLAIPMAAETVVQRLAQARGQQTHGERVDDIVDPIGLDDGTFEAVGAQVVEALRPLLHALAEDPALR
jgi:protein-tyrosine phosphatase